MTERVETIVIGGGQAGLCMSHHLARVGREHIVLERGRVGERWRSERWDALHFQFPNWMMRLPGYAYDGPDPEGFMPRDGVVGFIEGFARQVAPPIRCGIQVTRVSALDTGRFRVTADGFEIESQNVVLATGPYQAPRVPASSAALPPAIVQLTANRYANPARLPEGNVLVMGAGASGYQIAEDLAHGGKAVYLSVRGHRRVPRRYRGKDFGWWQEQTGASEAIVDPLAPCVRAPLLTGARGGHDADFRRLERQGVTLLGSLLGVEGGRIHFADDLARNLARGDEAFHDFTRAADRYAADHDLDGILPRPYAACRGPIRANLAATDPPAFLDHSHIGTVVWALGYQYDFSWVEVPAFDCRGMPVHRRGVTNVPGLYFLGLPRMHKVKSAFLWGVGEDAAYLAERISAHAGHWSKLGLLL